MTDCMRCGCSGFRTFHLSRPEDFFVGVLLVPQLYRELTDQLPLAVRWSSWLRISPCASSNESLCCSCFFLPEHSLVAHRLVLGALQCTPFHPVPYGPATARFWLLPQI